MVFFIVTAAGFLVKLVSGEMFDNLGPAFVLIPAGMITITGFIVLIAAQSEFQFLIAGFLYGFGFRAIFPALQTVCLNLVEEHNHEDAIGTFFNFFDLGIGRGSLLLGAVAEAFSYQATHVLIKPNYTMAN
jgi:predicted MFS family arabinose efflux permease